VLSLKKETIRQQTAKMFIITTVEFTFNFSNHQLRYIA
jgi:hypothetical protein